MKSLYIVILLLSSHLIIAQVDVEGVVLDAKKQPVPYAFVGYNNQFFTSAGENGEFSLKIPDAKETDTITVTALGFVPYETTLAQLGSAKPFIITLQPYTFELDGVTVTYSEARNHWLKALQKLQQALPGMAYTYPAYFRQVHQENGTYVRLIEAGMTVYDVAVTYQAGILQERFSLQQVRRSNVYERNGDEHGDHLVDMFMENCVRYPSRTVMDAKAVMRYEVNFADCHCTICGDSLEMLTYHYRQPNDPKILDGKIWLYKGTMKLFGLEETASRNPNFRQGGISLGGGDHHWMFQESRKELRFEYAEGKVYLSSLHFEYLHHIQDRAVGMIRYEVAESFSFFCGAPTLRPDGFLPDRTFARSGNLYSRKYQYQPAFWEQYHLAIENPLPIEVAQPFSGKVPLDEQFKRNGE